MRLLSKIAVAGLMFVSLPLYAQTKPDKAEYIVPGNPFYDEILKGIDEYENPTKPTKKKMAVDLSNFNVPKSLDEFTKSWFNPPISQGNTGTCWCFASTSYLETEAYRQTGKKFKFSEMYTVYWEYVEKAKNFLRKQGDAVFAEGSEGNSPMKIWKLYGCMPEEAYNGMLPGMKFYGHEKLINEMTTYLQAVKRDCNWNEDQVIANIKTIMNRYMGEPPTEFTYNGKKYTPKSFLSDEVKIDPDDFVEIISLAESPYYQLMDYDVPDNWRHEIEYYNIPLDEFMSTLKNAVKNGYSVSIGGDVSEAGYMSMKDVAVVPSFDIPSQFIDENAREFRFANGTTGDDHGIHLVGYTVKDGVTWFLIKDSGSGCRNGNLKGYYMYHEDFVKLKMINYTVHKSAVVDLLKKFK